MSSNAWFQTRICSFISLKGSARSLGHIQSGKIPGTLLILGFPYRFTHHPRELVLSFRSPHSRHPEKDNIRQGNLTFDIQMQGWPPDFSPAAVGGGLPFAFAHAEMRGRDEGRDVIGKVKGKSKGEGGQCDVEPLASLLGATFCLCLRTGNSYLALAG